MRAVVFLVLYQLAFNVTGHTHHLHEKEREEDGNLSPRDKEHFAGGVHHNEFDHEALLGSAKEAREYEDLSPAEAKRRLEILLKKMDENTDLQIERKELFIWLQKSLRMLSVEESEERLVEVDLDGNGLVTWQEYVQETYGITDPQDTSSFQDLEHEEDLKLLNEDKELFDAADNDGDGQLNKEEFLDFSHPEESLNMLPLIVKQFMNEKDANQDGVIDFQEYMGEKGKDKSKEWLLTEKDQFDNEHDLDRSGALEYNEVVSWIAPSNDEVAAEEVQHLFAAADDDADDMLSFAEILSHHDLFVGSEVTDYGEHLQNIHKFSDEL